MRIRDLSLKAKVLPIAPAGIAATALRIPPASLGDLARSSAGGERMNTRIEGTKKGRAYL